MLLSPGLLIFSSINITDSFKNPLVTLSNTWNPNTAQIHFGQIVHKNEQLPPDMAQATNELLQPAAVEIGPWHPPGLAALTTSIVAWPRKEAAEPEVGVLIALLEWRAGMGCREFTKDFSCSFCWRFFVFLEAEALETMKHNETESWGRFDTHVMFAQECWPHCLHHQWSSSSLPAFVSPLRAGVWRISHQLALVDTSHTNGAGNFSCPVSFRGPHHFHLGVESWSKTFTQSKVNTPPLKLQQFWPDKADLSWRQARQHQRGIPSQSCRVSVSLHQSLLSAPPALVMVAWHLNQCWCQDCCTATISYWATGCFQVLPVRFDL